MGRWLVLVGFMGVGKSTVGPLLADELGAGFVDCDAAIEEFAEMPIPEIFSRRGEVWFRRTEERVIRDVLAGEPGVFSLGGGAVESAKTRDLLRRAAHVAWLRLDPVESWTRVSGSDRPLATDRERFLRRAARREPLYAEVAHQTVDASAAPAAVASLIAEGHRAAEASGS